MRQVPYPGALTPGAEYSLANLLRDARRATTLTRPTVIITSAEFDLHPDHRAAAAIARILAKELRPAPELLMYLVHAHNFPEPYRLARDAALLPPRQFRHHFTVRFPIMQRSATAADAVAVPLSHSPPRAGGRPNAAR